MKGRVWGLEIRGWGMLAAIAFLSASCGYHVAGHADLMPKTVHTIAIPAFGNQTVHQKLSQLISEDLTREFISRTRYTIVAEPEKADAVLNGTVLQFASGPNIVDQTSGRATGAIIIVILQVTLTDRQTGKTIFSRPRYEFRERYEISLDPQAYFDESGTAIIRLSRDVARSVVTAILVDF
ncbi:MAG TPA: LPS assembly lipoprotein LptE [Bryobacteraceae bacterium]|nr:LPS assembly lipoprotein LptE [Bryobacteraceae bacterium]